MVSIQQLSQTTAFDTISHSLLLSRLESDYGVRSNVLEWIQSYVMDRKQFVKLGCHTSATSLCTAGVPQGSVLGPLLSTAYVAPIGHVIESFGIGYHQFADDTQLFVAVDTADSADLTCVTDCSDTVRRWFLENDLLLKSESVVIGTAAELKSATAASMYVTFAESSLPISGEVKSLGVTLDSQLRFDSHVKAVAKACAYHTHALRHLRHVRYLLASQLATTIACKIVATRIDDCNSLLYSAPAATFDALQHVQNILARVETQSVRRSSAKPLLESLHWLPVHQRVTYELATVCYKARSTSTPAYQSLPVPHVPSGPVRSSHAPRLAVPRT